MGLFEFIKDLDNLSYLFLFLPALTYFISGHTTLFIISLVCAVLLMAYKIDLKNKIPLIVQARIKTKRKNKRLIRNWRSMVGDADKEFSHYMFSWKFFGTLYVIFIGIYVYSTFVSFNYSTVLFAAHLAVAIFFIFLSLIHNYNLNNLAKQKRRKDGKKKN